MGLNVILNLLYHAVMIAKLTQINGSSPLVGVRAYGDDAADGLALRDTQRQVGLLLNAEYVLLCMIDHLHIINKLKQLVSTTMQEFLRVLVDDECVTGSYMRNLSKLLAGAWYMSETGDSIQRIRNFFTGRGQVMSRGAPELLIQWLDLALKDRVLEVRHTVNDDVVTDPAGAIVHIHPLWGGMGLPDVEGKLYAGSVSIPLPTESPLKLAPTAPRWMSSMRAGQVRSELTDMGIQIDDAQCDRITEHCMAGSYAGELQQAGHGIRLDSARAEYLLQDVKDIVVLPNKTVLGSFESFIEWAGIGAARTSLNEARERHDTLCAEASVAGVAEDWLLAVAAKYNVSANLVDFEWAPYGPNVLGNMGEADGLIRRFINGRLDSFGPLEDAELAIHCAGVYDDIVRGLAEAGYRG